MVQSSKNEHQNKVTVVAASEIERLRQDIFRPDMEKFRLFTQMLRTNKLYSRAKISHK